MGWFNHQPAWLCLISSKMFFLMDGRGPKFLGEFLGAKKCLHPTKKRKLSLRTPTLKGEPSDTLLVTNISGQIIATSHDRFSPNGGLVREIHLFQGNLGW